MPNTTIQIKKSSTPSAVPSNLANGELAINFADGKLFYKNTNGSIVEIASGGNNFGTVNANNTLVVADTPGDVLTLASGDNIVIVGDAVDDKITISTTPNAYNQANTALTTAQAAFDKANTGGGGVSSFTANIGNNSANTFNVAHNLNKAFVVPAVIENATGYYVYPDIRKTSANTIVFEFIDAPTTNQYCVIVVG